MPRMPAFIPSLSLNSTAPPRISLNNLTSHSAHISWTPPTPATLFLTSPLSPHPSVRRAIHPSLRLLHLLPSTPYSVQLQSPSFSCSLSFTTEASESSPLPLTELSRLDIRIGRILSCEPHPDADSLYVESVDVGEDEPRTIVSGLVNYVPVDQMLDRSVVVLCNLKPRAMRGILSQGMLLCASNGDKTKVDPLAPPQGVEIGEVVTFEGHRAEPIQPGNRATKAFDRVVDELRTDDDAVAKYGDVPFSTSKGPCVSPAGIVGTVS